MAQAKRSRGRIHKLVRQSVSSLLNPFAIRPFYKDNPNVGFPEFLAGSFYGVILGIVLVV
jgi:hypothetical protein